MLGGVRTALHDCSAESTNDSGGDKEPQGELLGVLGAGGGRCLEGWRLKGKGRWESVGLEGKDMVEGCYLLATATLRILRVGGGS